MKRSIRVAALSCLGIAAFGLLSNHNQTVLSAEKDELTSPGDAKNAEQKQRLPLEIARDRAEVLHDVYEATLEVMHHRYFHGDRATVPARAMQDIFSIIERQSKVEARWIAVNLKAMSIDHEPETKFEKAAARAIAKGRKHIEVVEKDFYRRAAAIPLSAGCVGCHGGLSSGSSTTPKFAGLVISVPIQEGSEDVPVK